MCTLQEQVKALGQDLSGLENELDAMKPPARDVKTVRQQIDDVNKLITKVQLCNVINHILMFLMLNTAKFQIN